MSDTTPEHAAASAARPRYWISRAAVLLIMGAWVYAGVSKVRNIDRFLATIEQHDIIPTQYRLLGLLLPLVELLLALLLVFVLGSELRKAFGRTVLVMSASLVVFFVVYLSMVPDVVLQQSGCGCWGKNGTPIPIASGIENSVRVNAMFTTGVLLTLHAVAFFGPIVTARRQRARSIASS